MEAYRDMIREVLTYGTRKENRTGVDTLSTFNYNYELAWDPGMLTTTPPKSYTVGPWSGEGQRIPLLTTKEISWKNIVVEMLWFLSGNPTIEILKRHNCKFWDAWADEDGKVPMAYGEQWRRFPVHAHQNTDGTLFHISHSVHDSHRSDDQGSFCGQDGRLSVDHGGEPSKCPSNWVLCPECAAIWKKHHSDDPTPKGPPHQGPLKLQYNDQIAYALKTLRENPMSRRIVVSAWAPQQAQKAALPPCHMLFAFNVQNVDVGGGQTEPRLCLHLTQRSCDLALGVPYNMASYSLLLLIFSHLTGIKPGIFAHTLLDLHIYTSKPDGSMAEYDHVPGLKGQLERSSKALPVLTIDPNIKELSDIEALMGPDVPTQTILDAFNLEGYVPWPKIPFKVAV